MPTRKRVLVVEDDPLVAEIVLDTLQDDYEVAHAGDAAGAVAGLGKGPVDLLLLDCTLPGGLGQELVPAADAAGIPILLMSGNPERALQVPGNRAFILKPFSLGALLDKVAGLLAQ